MSGKMTGIVKWFNADKELRLNRLTMLEKLRELFLRVADISLLQ